jgi:hypothetical protein
MIKIPTTEQLDLAVTAAHLDDTGHDELTKVGRASHGFLALWAGLLAANFGIEAPGESEQDMDAFKRVFSEVGKPARTAAKDALVYGLQIGLELDKINQITDLPSVAGPITNLSLLRATAKFALNTLDEGAEAAVDTFNRLAKSDLFVSLMVLAYNLGRDPSTKADVPALNQDAVDALSKDGDQSRRIGLALALGLMVGRLIPADAKEPDREEVKQDLPITGGWR